MSGSAAAAGSIPRAITCPTFPSLSSKGGSPRGGLPTWRGAAPWPPRPLRADALRAAASSRGILAATAVLYTLALLGLPVLYSRWPRQSANSTPAAVGGGDLPAAALAEGVLQPAQLAQALGSRRLALQGGSTMAAAAVAAAALWPDAGLARRHFGSTTAQLPRVEYRDAGNVVALVDALNSSHWDELPLYHANPLPSPAPQAYVVPGSTVSSGGGGGSSSKGGHGKAGTPPPPRFSALCPEGDIRLFIGVTSRCCTAEAQAKRDAIRRTWLQYAKEHVPGIAVRFILAQPSTEADLRAAMELLRAEIQQHADIIIVPGQDLYRNLPSKTLQLFKYALSSQCHFTHVMKADDDVHLRPQMLMDIISTGHHNFSVDIQAPPGLSAFDGQPAPYYQSPWMHGMYVGQLDSDKNGTYPGWRPNRDHTSKWFLSQEDLPDEYAPLGVRWASGWGYMLSRDLVEHIANTALLHAAVPERRPLWWGRMPWEDIMTGTLLSTIARMYHHDGFKAAWQECDKDTVLKHLDSDAPLLQDGLYAQELSGLWSKKSIVCSSGPFKLNNHSDWRIWRNSLPDNQIGGFM